MNPDNETIPQPNWKSPDLTVCEAFKLWFGSEIPLPQFDKLMSSEFTAIGHFLDDVQYSKGSFFRGKTFVLGAHIYSDVINPKDKSQPYVCLGPYIIALTKIPSTGEYYFIDESLTALLECKKYDSLGKEDLRVLKDELDWMTRKWRLNHTVDCFLCEKNDKDAFDWMYCPNCKHCAAHTNCLQKWLDRKWTSSQCPDCGTMISVTGDWIKGTRL